MEVFLGSSWGLKNLKFRRNTKNYGKKIAKLVQGGTVYGENCFGCFRARAALGRDSPTVGIGELLSQGPRPQTPRLTGELCTKKVRLEQKKKKGAKERVERQIRPAGVRKEAKQTPEGRVNNGYPP